LICVLSVREPMNGFGTATFADTEELGPTVPGASINLVLTSRCDFNARLTWVNTAGALSAQRARPEAKAAAEQAHVLIDQAEALGEPPEDPLT
jgi:hypothetical protein